MEGLFAPWHIAIVLVIALLVFGPKSLPQMGHSLGKSVTGFRQGLQDAKEELSGVMKEAADTNAGHGWVLCARCPRSYRDI